jgi:hypothetical protein
VPQLFLEPQQLKPKDKQHPRSGGNLMSLAVYEHDYFQWLVNQVDLLRTGHIDELDLDNLAEEIEDLGKNERRSLESDLVIVLMHLLKWQYQPGRRGNSWRYSILEHRDRLEERLAESPSLKPYLQDVFDKCYRKARISAAKETELDLATFPEESPFSLEEAMDEEFLPGSSLS